MANALPSKNGATSESNPPGATRRLEQLKGVGDFWPVQEAGDSSGLRRAAQRARGRLRTPLGSFLRLAPGLIQFHKPLVGEIEMIVIWNGNSIFARQHSLIAFQQQRFGFGISLLSR